MRRWRDCRRQMFADDPFQVRPLARAGSESFGPGAPRVQDVPRRPLLSFPPPAGGVIAETFEDQIPERFGSLDEQRFSQRNPDVVDSQVAAMEVIDVEVYRLFDVLRMIS